MPLTEIIIDTVIKSRGQTSHPSPTSRGLSWGSGHLEASIDRADQPRDGGRGAHQKGMTSIEVLIAFVILAIGMLGIASMLMLSSKTNNSSYAKQQAVQCVYDMFDKIRANYQSAISGNYNISNINSTGSPTSPVQPGTMCNLTPCSPTEMAAYDTWYWLTYDVTKLPSGSGSITSALAPGTAGNTIITVTVQWDDSLAQNLVGASSAASSSNPNYVQLSIQSQL